MSTQLLRIAELAKKDQEVKFTSLAHHLTPNFLGRSFKLLNQKAAAGTDGVRMEDFKGNLKENIETLWKELREGRYRAGNVRRKYIPKPDGRERPLGIPTVRDRVVQRAVAEIINVIYEPYFRDCSYGFRPKRSAHDALKKLETVINNPRIRYVVDADIKGYFDNVNHQWMMTFLRHRIADRTILRLVSKFLNAGVMESGVVVRVEKGTPQGGPISPLLANIYLHYVLDLWFERRIRKQCKGTAELIRYADDFVTCFERKAEAEAFVETLRKRFSDFGLELSAEKTKVVELEKERRPRDGTGSGPSQKPRAFDFLGYTHFLRREWRDRGACHLARKPSRKTRNRFLQRVKEWCNEHRHRHLRVQGKHLRAMLLGYYNYFGLAYHRSALWHVKWHTTRLWISALRRRGQRHRLYWSRITAFAWYKLLPDPSPS